VHRNAAERRRVPAGSVALDEFLHTAAFMNRNYAVAFRRRAQAYGARVPDKFMNRNYAVALQR